jgi:hypothetical protein
LLIASVTVVIAEVLLALAFILLPAYTLGADVSNVGNFILFYTFWVALVTGIILIVLGMPIYQILARKQMASAMNIGGIGFIIPVVIFILITEFFSVSDSFSSGENYYGTYREMIIDGNRTMWGWIRYAENTIKFGIHGLVGALVFRKAMSVADEWKDAT